MNHARLVAFSLAVASLGIPACGTSYEDRRAMVDAEWAVTNARTAEINSEYSQRTRQATTPEERNAAAEWRADELAKNFADHDTRVKARLAGQK